MTNDKGGFINMDENIEDFLYIYEEFDLYGLSDEEQEEIFDSFDD